MLTEYCSAGFPHSEICGSKLICSSPQLIAACHVLHRLLMPRHSPCALISLTFVGADSISLASGLRRKLTHSIAPPLRPKPASLGFVPVLRNDLNLLFLVLKFKNYAGSQKLSFGSLFLPLPEQLSPFFRFSTIAIRNFPLLLAANTFNLHCSVFKVQSYRLLLKPDTNSQLLSACIHSQTICIRYRPNPPPESMGVSSRRLVSRGNRFPLEDPSCAKRKHFSRNAMGRGGGDNRTRTDDPLLAKQVLSQLSYTPS
jgi:hypothetical protein